MGIISEIGNHRVKRSETWDSGVLMEHLWDTFDHHSRSFCGHSVPETFFRKYYFHNAATSTLMILSQSNLL